MSNIITVKVPDIGDFKDIPVIEVLVKAGDTVAVEQSLITLETDKATMDVPAPVAGVVKQVKVKVGDKVTQGSVILTLEQKQDAGDGIQDVGMKSESSGLKIEEPAKPTAPVLPASRIQHPQSFVKGDIHAEVLVLGAGPGGYTAAFRAADLGKQVVMVERYATLGGVCLNVGCIPSKALLHAAKVITEAAEMAEHGIAFSAPKIDLDKLRAWKSDAVVGKHVDGLVGLAKQRKIKVLHGVAEFTSPHHLKIKSADGEQTISFDHAIVAAGSSIARIPGFPYDDARLLDSTSALQLQDIPKRMLIIGGGIIGLEMATVYDALGSKISVVELADGLIPGADRDIVRPLHKRIERRYEAIYLKTKVNRIEPTKQGLQVHFEGEQAPAAQLYDRVLLAVGRRPNGREIGAAAAGIGVNERGFITVDSQMRTNVPHIFAVGDIVGDPMLAHKAVHEGKVAAEVIAGHLAAFEPLTIPSVAYTDPEIAWMGLTETQAKAQGIAYEKSSFPWAASGRASSIGRNEGVTKLLYDPQSKRILGCGIVGVNAGELIAETVLALEMGADMADLGLTIHPHPTLSESVGLAAEIGRAHV